MLESSNSNSDMCNFGSSQKDESSAQSADSSKTYSKLKVLHKLACLVFQDIRKQSHCKASGKAYFVHDVKCLSKLQQHSAPAFFVIPSHEVFQTDYNYFSFSYKNNKSVLISNFLRYQHKK